MAIAFDRATNAYTVTNGGRSATFTAADRQTTSGYADIYSKGAGTTERDELTLFGNLGGTTSTPAPIQLSYLSYAKWVSNTGGFLLQPAETWETYFLAGYATTAAAMPTSGTATYRTFVAASGADNGTASLSVNFGTGKIDTTLTFPYGTYLGRGDILRDGISGSFTSTAPFFTDGSFVGGFFGPGAAEAGYAFALNHHNPDPYAGAAAWIGPIRIGGVVLGKKD